MRTIIKICLTALPLLFASHAVALDLSKPFLCASLDVHECVDGARCREVLPEDVNAPTFFRVDMKKKQIRVSKSGEPTEIEHVDTLEGRIVLQGVEDGNPEIEDGAGWTMTIEEDTARMVVTATTRQAAIVIFGACTKF